jgi:ABC-type nitrate/sulfonate/bicarbonate transport system substrate-binding protein
MGKFRIQSHGRLQEWVAEEKGYFKAAGLDYEFLVKPIITWAAAAESVESSPDDIQRGAFESIEDGRGCNLSAACHWTVNMAASAGHGKMWGRAYSVSPSGVFMAADSPIQKPEQLANLPVSVGYHSGSHYSTLQGLERFLKREEIKLHFGGLLLDRLALLVDRQVPAASLFGAPYYVAEQLGFRKMIDTTFMIGHVVSEDADLRDVEGYFEALRRAQHDIDLEPEAYKHYFLRELPERYHDLVDIRRFGPGERLVFEPYSQAAFERTRQWIESWNLFPPEQKGSADYESSVIKARPVSTGAP